jgi:ubiquinone/menaquinone biosynthesis C-methylase UbiE
MNKNSRKHYWDSEYRDPLMMAKDSRPQKHVLRFVKWMRRKKPELLQKGINVLDMGCGLGRNLAFFHKKFGCSGTGYDISTQALSLAKKEYADMDISFYEKNIGTPFRNISDASVDIVLDVTSSHLLTEHERSVYVAELGRVVRSGGIIYFRTFALEADKNAKTLLKQFPGKEQRTYVHPVLGTTERVFRRKDIIDLYEKDFILLHAERTSGYQRANNQSYKRNYWECYLERK